MLVELLRAASREDEAREQLEKLAGEIEAAAPSGQGSGRRRSGPSPIGGRITRPQRQAPWGLVFLDTGFDMPVSPPRGVRSGTTPTAS